MRLLCFLLLLSCPALAQTATTTEIKNTLPAQPPAQLPNAQPAQPAAPAGALAPTAPASAPEGRQFGEWAAFQYSENGSATCYAATKSSGAFIYVTHRPVERTQHEFQFTAATNLKPGSTATLNIDKEKFKLFVDGNSAWIKGADNDKAIAAALRRAKKISINATDANDKALTVNFSSKGSSLALQAINAACGL